MKPLSRNAISFLLFLSFFAVLPRHAGANGVAWNIGAIPGTPGPMKQTELFLEKEHVIFKDRTVRANFWVRNPSDTDIEVTMGFPFKRKFYDNQEKIFWLSQIAEHFHVKSGEAEYRAELKEFSKGEYPLVFLWNMKFPKTALTEFNVIYPMDFEWSFADGGPDDQAFTYITHTGASWARPIGEATFEFYDKHFIDFITKYSPGVWWQDEDTLVDVNYIIRPLPYSINEEEGKIVWNRKNWVPKNLFDDIRVDYSWDYVTECPMSYEDCAFEALCGNGGYIITENHEQFAEKIDIDNIMISNEQAYNQYVLSRNDLKCIDSNNFNKVDRAHFHNIENIINMVDVKNELIILKYLRNYIAARHGHIFRDGQLSYCFKDIKVKKGWSETEKKNLDYIRSREGVLKKQYQELLEKNKARTISEDSFRMGVLGSH